MKKLLLILLLMVHAAASSGIALSIHFCMGDYAGVGFAREKQKICSNCGMIDRAGCCHDETRLLKLDNPVTSDAKWTPIAAISIVLPPLPALQVLSSSVIQPVANSKSCRWKDPGPPIHIYQCHFRI